MGFRFAAGVWATLAIAVGAATTGQGQAPAGRFQPYFAVRTIEIQDNVGKTMSKFYSLEERDSSGRRLTARLDSPVYGGKLTQASISDPVKTRLIEINYVAKTATVTQFPAAAADKLLPLSKPFATDDPNRSDLSSRTLNDFQVQGYTWTTSDPKLGNGDIAVPAAGVQAATTFNPVAYPVTHESWWSAQLSMFLLTSTKDGNGFTQIIHYDQIKLKEPGAEDFAIPAGFHVRTIQAGGR